MGGVLTFYYTSHDMNRFIPHVHRAQPLNGFENGPNLAENRILQVQQLSAKWKCGGARTIYLQWRKAGGELFRVAESGGGII